MEEEQLGKMQRYDSVPFKQKKRKIRFGLSKEREKYVEKLSEFRKAYTQQ